jgi:hypothetical protein
VNYYFETLSFLFFMIFFFFLDYSYMDFTTTCGLVKHCSLHFTFAHLNEWNWCLPVFVNYSSLVLRMEIVGSFL